MTIHSIQKMCAMHGSESDGRLFSAVVKANSGMPYLQPMTAAVRYLAAPQLRCSKLHTFTHTADPRPTM